MTLPLQDICTKFSRKQGIILSKDHTGIVHGDRGCRTVLYHFEPKDSSEILEIRQENECSLEAIADGKEKILIVKIAYGCMHDYLAMLKRSSDLYSRVVYRRYEERLRRGDLFPPALNDFAVEDFKLVPRILPDLLDAVFVSGLRTIVTSK